MPMSLPAPVLQQEKRQQLPTERLDLQANSRPTQILSTILPYENYRDSSPPAPAHAQRKLATHKRPRRKRSQESHEVAGVQDPSFGLVDAPKSHLRCPPPPAVRHSYRAWSAHSQSPLDFVQSLHRLLSTSNDWNPLHTCNAAELLSTVPPTLVAVAQAVPPAID
ncbi:hypothetical protein M430DRAFT_21919 [Amorphotheca resinae ATCC 22711]|uniref:Uncharacterized protein n=1 Tax=Amorphotheca resinae ATCC 22711 TaxID=857342 RepID=A0A2T3ASU3_AMORE|nr:hypothetical protein M430DRAFT_21919 [Amorphotheca resinae ATCC 22711]PSS10564.1 hypothetical protein M430DRAFT_21919 [Amorphotheca resinae ATCC 22711]